MALKVTQLAKKHVGKKNFWGPEVLHENSEHCGTISYKTSMRRGIFEQLMPLFLSLNNVTITN